MLKPLRHFVYRYKYTHAPKLNLSKPVDVSLELSSLCNMACTYCYHSDQKNLPFQKGYMDRALAHNLVLQAADLGTHSIKFNYRGEATLHPHYGEIAELAKSFASKSTFIDRLTNSNFKFPVTRRDDIFKGFASLTKVKVSYDSFISRVFEAQRAGGNHSLTTSNIDAFYNSPYRIRSETELVIQAVRTKANVDEDIIGDTKRRWPEASVSIRDMVTGRVEKDLSNFENKSRDVNNRQSCIQAHARLIVHHDGKVSPCCPSIKNDLIIGDATRTPLEKIFNSYEAQRLRVSLLNGSAFDKEPCKSCPSFESFKGYKAPWGS